MPATPATNLQNLNICDTYYGVLHAGGVPIPSTGQAQIYDGNGTTTALKLGANCNGATICGTLSATSLQLQNKLTTDLLPVITPSVSGVYTGYVTGLTVNQNGLVTNVVTTSALSVPSPFKAYANVVLSIPYNDTTNQGTNFTIVGNNIQSVTWIKTGLYRVAFTTPMTNTNYIVMLQNATTPLSGQYPDTAARSGEDVLVLGFKNTNFFEFSCTQTDGGKYNLQAFGLLVI